MGYAARMIRSVLLSPNRALVASPAMPPPEDAMPDAAVNQPHPRTLGWIGTTALAMGGSNQSLFLLTALFVGQGDILGQGSAAVPLLIVGLLLAAMAAPGWTELVLMYPRRVGGIAATCTEAFRPYSPLLANLTGVCYWWGWVPTCGLTAILSASAIHQWYLPGVPAEIMAVALVIFFTAINLCGIRWVSRLAVPIATISATMAFISGLAPIIAGDVNWSQATSFDLTVPFPGWFGELTSLMAGLYLIGFAAPAFEAAACHVGETIDPNRNVPRAMLASGGMASVFFVLLPVVWLGTLGAQELGTDLALAVGPTFAPVFGSAAKAAAIWFMMFNMFHGTLQPLAGAARTLSQLSEDGLLPRVLALRSRNDAPWVATVFTAMMAILFLLIGDPIWLIAAANFTYLIGIALPSVAVWLLRRDAPEVLRPYKAPRLTIMLGLAAAVVWGISALLGFEQYGLPTVVVGLAFAYSGSVLYAWRKFADRRRAGLPGLLFGLQAKLTGAMLLVLLLDGTGYLLAVHNLPQNGGALLTVLSDIFVAVAMLTIAVALVLPGMIAHSATAVSSAAKRLTTGTLAEFSRAIAALGRGDINSAHARVDITPVRVHARDEVGEMAQSFNALQAEIGHAAVGLDGAREGLRQARLELTQANTALEQRVVELHLAEEKLSGILNSIENVVWSISATGDDLLYLNPAAERVYGRRVEDFRDNKSLWWGVVHPDDRQRVQDGLAELLQSGTHTLQYRILRPDGEVRWLEDHARLVLDANQRPLRIDGVATDISERKTHEAKIEHLATHDALTGLPNRTLLDDRIALSLVQARRVQRRLALLFLDLDNFKLINDTYGHGPGDGLLKEIAARLSGAMRDGDTVARQGGDEFVIMLWDLAEADDAAIVAQKVLDALARPFRIEGQEVHVTASIGVSVYPEDGNSSDLLLRHADAAMYLAKELGRNGFQFYTREMGKHAQERAVLENALRYALDRGEFELHYQPQVDLKTGRIIGAEALLRWRHPELGMVSPMRFIPLAEATGLIVPIGAWVLRTACTEARAWIAAGHPALTVAVNMSARQFYRQDVPELVRSVLEQTGLPADRLELELTESTLMKDTETVVGTLRQLKDIGVALGMDDFGTGYSSLSYLRRFELDILKIDQSFVADLPHSRDAMALTRTIIAMARALDIRTIAEGVETPGQLKFLRDNACDAMQGYYFSRPLPVAEMTALLREGTRLDLSAIDRGVAVPA
jgi:diguanylate cyclase (GGDEF)-like protein/PAS domain S-box-containing protein